VKFYTKSLAKTCQEDLILVQLGQKISGILYKDLRMCDAAESNMSLSNPKYNLLLALPCPPLIHTSHCAAKIMQTKLLN
jgi:hypothetical protein